MTAWAQLLAGAPAPARSEVGRGLACDACGCPERACRKLWRRQRKCCPDCSHGGGVHRQPRQLVLPGVQPAGLDLEWMLHGELLAAMAAVLARPELWELDEPPADVPAPFCWPQQGTPLVHYPEGADGGRVEHPPGIVCPECQWGVDETGFPLAAHGRQPRAICENCLGLTRREDWCPPQRRCLGCSIPAGSQAE